MYEFDIRVPLMVRGPGVLKGVTNTVNLFTLHRILKFTNTSIVFLFVFVQKPVLNIDLAPTIIELAGGKYPDFMDGESFASLLTGNSTKS